MKHLIAVTFSVFTLLSGVTFANAGINDTQTEVEFKYPSDLTGFKYPSDLVGFKYPEEVGFKYPETTEFEYPLHIKSEFIYK